MCISIDKQLKAEFSASANLSNNFFSPLFLFVLIKRDVPASRKIVGNANQKFHWSIFVAPFPTRSQRYCSFSQYATNSFLMNSKILSLSFSG